MDDTTPITADQLAAHLRHSPRAVARAATEIAYAAGSSGNVGPWRAFCAAWRDLFGAASDEEAAEQMQRLAYETRGAE